MDLFKMGKCIPAMFSFDNTIFNKARPYPYVLVEMNEKIIITKLNSFGKKTKDTIKIELDDIDHIDISCLKGFNGGIHSSIAIAHFDFYLEVNIVLQNGDKYSLMNSSVVMINKLCAYLDNMNIKYYDKHNLIELLNNVRLDSDAYNILKSLSDNFDNFIK